ncbi:hypothetical protein HMP09_2669 [Sphingomonas sp. HMP9]|uniref:hypothetical protein n=1 Tax=Sphingomonas sp. HMP9 TaxID=1517554 RepID=UPI0015969F7D|nr:hypothetical protein [Sphingomonas sp. HMP9]BCA63435.1 hypothetical protein HMP09_2669 [Sphingomonas sp. HMP9]
MGAPNEERLRETLPKIEALYAAAGTQGEKVAAGAAAERLRRRFEKTRTEEASEEFRFSISDPWSRQLFVALCRRYGLRPFRYSRMHRQSVVVQGPRSFVDGVLWPEFEELSVALTSHLGEITDRIIREEVHASTQDAEEVRETSLLSF